MNTQANCPTKHQFSSLLELKDMVDSLLAEHGDMKVSIINTLHGPKMVIEKDRKQLLTSANVLESCKGDNAVSSWERHKERLNYELDKFLESKC